MARKRNPKRAQQIEKTKQIGKPFQGFMEFVREQGIVGLAIGLAIGTQAGATVKAIVDGLISPIVGFIVGSNDGLTTAAFNVIGRDSDNVKYWLTLGDRTLVIKWGIMVSALITFLAVAAVIYWVIRGFKIDKLDKKK
jgi:large conductance mechanosensitive channel